MGQVYCHTGYGRTADMIISKQTLIELLEKAKLPDQDIRPGEALGIDLVPKPFKTAETKEFIVAEGRGTLLLDLNTEGEVLSVELLGRIP